VRRLTVECPDGHQEEITIGINDHIPTCQILVERVKQATKKEVALTAHKAPEGKSLVSVYLGPCRRRRTIVWTDGSAGFRIKGATKRF